MSSPSRELLIRQLQNHVPQDEKERADLEIMRAFAQSLESPFSRSQLNAHFTGSALVVDPEAGEVCLIYHKKLGRWLQPGGHAEEIDGGDISQTAAREPLEETGISVQLAQPVAILDVDVHTIPARGDEPEHLHLDVRFLVYAKKSDQLKEDLLEVEGAQWFGWDESKEKNPEPEFARMVEKARKIVASFVRS